MNIVEMVWACGDKPYETVVRVNENGKQYKEQLKQGGPCRHIRVRDTAWLDFLKLGQRYDWQPKGTLLMDTSSYAYAPLAEGETVIDSYHPGKCAEFKIIEERDAAAWSDALDRALADLEAGRLEVAFTKGVTILRDDMTAEEYAMTNNPANLNLLREFIAFLRKGPFHFYYDD